MEYTKLTNGVEMPLLGYGSEYRQTSANGV